MTTPMISTTSDYKLDYMSHNRLLIKWATRGRPEKFFEALEGHVLPRCVTKPLIVISFDEDDETMDNSRIVDYLTTIQDREKRAELYFFTGYSTSKIEAMNRNLDGYSSMTDHPYSVIMFGQDDMLPISHGFDATILEDMRQHYPDTDGCLWYNDGRRKDLNTLSVVGRRFYERLGYMYHPEFYSLWADDLHQFIAEQLDRLTHIDRCIVWHAWQDWTGDDALHARNSTKEVWERDKSKFIELIGREFKSLFLGDSKLIDEINPTLARTRFKLVEGTGEIAAAATQG